MGNIRKQLSLFDKKLLTKIIIKNILFGINKLLGKTLGKKGCLSRIHFMKRVFLDFLSFF